MKIEAGGRKKRLGQRHRGCCTRECNKRKAELIEKDWNKMEERLEKYAELYDEAVGVLPEEEREGASGRRSGRSSGGIFAN